MGNRERKPHSTWLGRFLRGRRLDRNQLRRGSDRAETAVIVLLAVAFAAGAPFAALGGGAWVHAVAQRQQAEQRADWRTVPAVTLTAAGAGGGPGGGYLNADAKARWTAPDGAVITSQIPVPAGTRAGQTIRVWVARDGTLTGPPLQDSQVSARVVMGEAGAVAGLAVTVALAGVASRRSLDRHRLAAWESEWRSTGPRWTTRA